MVYWWGKGEEQIQGECTEGEEEWENNVDILFD